MSNQYRFFSILTFILLAAASIFYAFRIQFSFEFEQFFPEGDEDLEFFQSFIKDFEVDDNFMLLAIERKAGVFDSTFLADFHDFTLKTRKLPHTIQSQSLTQVSYPLKTPFGITSIPAIHLNKPAFYENDLYHLMEDDRFVGNLINEDATALVVYLKNTPSIQLAESKEFMSSLDSLVAQYNFDDHHFLGRAYFQQELVDMQEREILVTTFVAGLLVILVMFWIFRRPWGIGISLTSIGLGMLLFVGFLGAAGRELNAISALYPILMIIVGTSDVIHIMSKYIDELKRGKPRLQAIKVTIKEIGLATLFTSITTAIGFASLYTSKIYPIKDFGINAAAGVLIAYITVLFLTTALLSFFKKEQLIKLGKGQAFWNDLMNKFYHFTKNKPRQIAIGGTVAFFICMWGISKITTNYTIIQNMPKGEKITSDFHYFENTFTGFRPMEIAVFAQNDLLANDYSVLKEIDKVEQHIKSFPQIRATSSVTDLYKSINRMHKNNKKSAYVLPKDEATYRRYHRMIDKVPAFKTNVLLSNDEKKARITSRMTDYGADSIKVHGLQIDKWILENTDTNIVKFRRTGTGLIIDKNAEYVRTSLLQGLAFALLIVSILMALLFQNWKMLIISLIPNLFPLLMAGALLGFIGIELEAGVSVVFAIAFGIAVDDTIHFLSKFKLARRKGLNIEESLHLTFVETGKAICLTTIILFFGFLITMFSIHPPSVAIGLLISVTLFAALFADLLLIPVLIRKLMKD